jgi:hypothetical protein
MPLINAFPPFQAPASPLQAGQAGRAGVQAGVPQPTFMKPVLAKPNKASLFPGSIENQSDVFNGANLGNVLAALRK